MLTFNYSVSGGDMYGKNAQDLFNRLRLEGIIGAEGSISMELLGEKVAGNDKSVVGYSLQGWLDQWMTNKGIDHWSPENSQEPPDFYLSKNSKTDILELKSFNADASANFDIANFDAYRAMIETHPEHLDADYLIFSYSLKDTVLRIEGMWLKKIWEITCASDKYALKTQVKRDVIYNIRPASWMARNTKFPVFGTKEKFLKAIHDTTLVYHSPKEADRWVRAVAKKAGVDFLSNL